VRRISSSNAYVQNSRFNQKPGKTLGIQATHLCLKILVLDNSPRLCAKLENTVLNASYAWKGEESICTWSLTKTAGKERLMSLIAMPTNNRMTGQWWRNREIGGRNSIDAPRVHHAKALNVLSCPRAFFPSLQSVRGFYDSVVTLFVNQVAVAAGFRAASARFSALEIGTDTGAVGNAATSSSPSILVAAGTGVFSSTDSAVGSSAVAGASRVDSGAASSATRTALPSICLSGMAFDGLCGPISSTWLWLLWSATNLSDGSHWLCSGTPSAAGSSPAASRSSPQNEGRRTGAGVTGSEGRSISVGKSVILILPRRSCCGWASEAGDVIDWSPEPDGPWVLFKRTWILA